MRLRAFQTWRISRLSIVVEKVSVLLQAWRKVVVAVVVVAVVAAVVAAVL